MTDPVVFLLSAMSIGQIFLTTTILVWRASKTPAYIALAVFMIAVGLISYGHILAALLPQTEVFTIVVTLPALLSLGPLIWFYVEGLTSETLWRFEMRHSKQLALAFCGIFVCFLLLVLPAHEQHTMFIKGEVPERLYPTAIVMVGGCFLLGWFVQAGYYWFRSVKRLALYRTKLKNVFSSTEQRELRWVMVIFGLLGVAWFTLVAFISVSTIYDKEIINPRFGASLSCLIIWLMSVWGLRQKPGFEGEYKEENQHLNEKGNTSAKYHRSGLEAGRAEIIAKKIEAAMAEDTLYLDANLSLSKLSKHIAVTSNHISQTLNETMSSNFFNYVNGWRVEEAKKQIKNTGNSILEISIDVGFNSRSSFYKAFKFETGMTPNEFKNISRQK